MAIKEGQKAPDFKAKADGNKTIKLSDYSDNWVILYFYPKDNTSGCTKEACGFNENLKHFEKLDAEILGVSPDSVESHDKFKEKYDLKFNLISDPKNEIASDYGAYGKKKMFGNEYMGIIRSTFIIDPEGIVRKSYKNVRVKNHVEKVMDELRTLKKM